MRILVCGGRHYNRYDKIREAIQSLLPQAREEDITSWLPPSGTVIIHGGATGADALADQWAVANWVKIEEFKADWNKYGKAAGPKRNQQMIDEGKPDVVIAAPGGKGTEDMVRRATAAGIKVIRIKP